MKEIEIVPDGFKGERPEIRRAREKALILLSYSDYTKKRMREKLTASGFSDLVISEVLDYLTDRRYIDEPKFLRSFSEYCVNKKLYGKRKLLGAINEKGFDRECVEENLDDILADFDFVEICKRHIEKAKRVDVKDRAAREKLIASLSRKGFSLAEIKTALIQVINGEE